MRELKLLCFPLLLILLTSPSSPSSVPPSNARRYGELPPLGEALRAAEGVGPYDVDGTFSVPGTPSLSS